jgi:cytochrome bd ubiquinol oxidase subunit I
MIFAALGIGLPVLLLIAEALWLRTKQQHYYELARTWSKATALTFAVGAVSGTALSFELGLLWPQFMEVAGPSIGSAFTLEGYAFFIEAIFIGLYLYGWNRLTPFQHWLTGIPIALSGLASGILVVAANAWMQAPPPTIEADPLAPFKSPAWFHMSLHSSLSCYVATGFAAAGVYAVGMLRGRRDVYHRSALRIAMAVAIPTALLQPLSGDVSARAVARLQPAKLAASEAHFKTQSGAPLLLGGIPDVEREEVRFGFEIPRALSFLAHHDFNAEVTGLDAFPRDERPNVLVSHLAFQIMVGCGTLLALVSILYLFMRRKQRDTDRWFLRLLLICAPLGFLALEAGWVVTEVGRQPWVIYGRMRTSEAVTTASNVGLTFALFCVLYLVLGLALIYLLRHLAHARRSEATHAA